MRNLKPFLNLNHSVAENCQQLAVGYFDFNKNIFLRDGYNYVYKEGNIFGIKSSDGTYKTLLTREQLQFENNTTSVALFYNPVLNSLNIVLEVGGVLSISLDQQSSLDVKQIEFLGSIATGFRSAALSPDAETVVFLSTDNCVIVMSGDFEPIGQTDLLGSDQGENKMVNVGWGKKETQFHGSEGKAAAKKAISEEECLHLNEGEEIKHPCITWRGDSSYFAVNYWCPDKNIRKVKIFDKCGTLQCTSEFLSG